MIKKSSILLIIAILVMGCNTAQGIPQTNTLTAEVETPIPPGYPWWNEKVGYEIFVRSFYDSNGDGIGDFNGITEKLDYLNDGDPNTTTDLGITTIWLMPIFPSPSYHGYDVTDYYSVNPQYGTMDDFRQLLKEAHERDIQVVIDMVLNHTSDQHPWFKEAKIRIHLTLSRLVYLVGIRPWVQRTVESRCMASFAVRVLLWDF